MEKCFLVVIVIFATSKAQTIDSNCLTKPSLLGGEHLICVNATPSYFQYSGIKLNRSHWLTCIHCKLNLIKENTFNFPKNNISYLNLTQSNILTIEIYGLNKFHMLKYLSLKQNLIETIDSKAFAGLRRLLHLDMSLNKLKIVGSNTFAELENLDILNLNSNNITYIHNDAFVGLMNLKYLYLNNNKIKTLLADSFKHLINLKILYLESNKISHIHPVAFNNLRNLNYLYLNNNSLSFLVQYNFKQLSSLIDLQLRYNNLSEIQTSNFNGLVSLKFLYLGHNNLTSIQPYGLIGLNSLLVLDLIGNNFRDFNLNYFKSMSSLTTLWLEENNLKNIIISKDGDTLPSMKVVDLMENSLKSFDYKLLYEKLPNVQDILIGRNKWTCEFLVEMYDLYVKKNISVCLNTKCNITETYIFINNTCSDLLQTGEGGQEGIENTEYTSLDFSVDSCNSLTLNLVFYAILSLCKYFI